MKRELLLGGIIGIVIILAIMVGIVYQPTVYVYKSTHTIIRYDYKDGKIYLEHKISLVPHIKLWKNGKLIYSGVDPPTQNLVKLFYILFYPTSPAETTVVNTTGYSINIYMGTYWANNEQGYDFLDIGSGTTHMWVQFGNGSVTDIYTAYSLGHPISPLLTTTVDYNQSTNGDIYLSITAVWSVTTNNTVAKEVGLIMTVADIHADNNNILVLYTPINVTANAGDNITVSFIISVTGVGALQNFAKFMYILFAPTGGIGLYFTTIDGVGNTYKSGIGFSWSGYLADIDMDAASSSHVMFAFSNSASIFHTTDYTLTNIVRTNHVLSQIVSYGTVHQIWIVSSITSLGDYVKEIGMEYEMLMTNGGGTYVKTIMLNKYVLPNPVYVPANTTLVVAFIFDFSGG